MKKQKTDWVKELKEKFGCYPECGCDLLPCIERKELVEFISQLLKTQREQLKKEHKENISLIREKFRQYGIKTGRQQLISEIEGILGEDEDEKKLWRENNDSTSFAEAGGEEMSGRNELRKQIRERLKQITNLKEK